MTRFLRYFIVGGCAALVAFTFFLAFSTWLGFHYLAVGAVGFVIATFVNYVLARRWVFGDAVQRAPTAELGAVYAVSALGLALHAFILWGAVRGLALPGPVGKVVATGGVFLWNYAARAHFIYRRP